MKNFKEAGVSEYIDARLADAHVLVPELKGTIDFVFCDADKNWYLQYFKDIAPKLKVGGCYTAHNITTRRGRFGVQKFVDYVLEQPNFRTTIDRKESTGISVSYKRSKK